MRILVVALALAAQALLVLPASADPGSSSGKQGCSRNTVTTS
ncbi:hypothetical protein [Tianweitania sediminis]|nr:hypothetical protein [Tianweitania sediminis]